MQDRAEIREVLRRVPFLASLSDKKIDALSAALSSRSVRAGEILFRQGDQGDAMIIVGKGRLSVRVAQKPGAPETEVAAIYPGEVVGEMACVDPAPRSASVVASKAAFIFEVQRKMLQAIQSKAPAVAVAIVGGVITYLTRRIRETNERIERELRARGLFNGGGGGAPPKRAPSAGPAAHKGKIDLRSLACLKDFQNEELRALLRVAPSAAYANGQDLCREGDAGKSCYIIARGKVDVVRFMSGRDRVLATLDEGAMVGQMALVDRAKRSATIRANGDCVVLELQRDAFVKLLEMQSPLAIRFQNQIAIAGIRQLRTATERLTSLLNSPKPVARRPELRPPAAASAPAGQRKSPPLRPPGHGSGAPARRPTAGPPGQRPGPPGRAPGPSGRTPGPPGRSPLPGMARLPRGTPIGDGRGVEKPRKEMTEREEEEMLLAYMQAALGEWDMDVGDLDKVKVTRPDGYMSAAEKKSRGL